MIGKLGELLVLLTVLGLLAGSRRLPDLARSLGQSFRILRSETEALRNDGAGTSAPAARRTIQAAPGDTASARPVGEPTTQQR